jgi:hypothetical protein
MVIYSNVFLDSRKNVAFSKEKAAKEVKQPENKQGSVSAPLIDAQQSFSYH